MGIKSKTHFHIPYKSRWWKCAWLEQVTRVELAGNSLGSCRHTARRHLQLCASNQAPRSTQRTYYISFLCKCQRFLISILNSPRKNCQLFTSSWQFLHTPKNSTLYPRTENPCSAVARKTLSSNPAVFTSATLPQHSQRA